MLVAATRWQILGWRPEVDFEAGIRETIEWYRGKYQK